MFAVSSPTSLAASSRCPTAAARSATGSAATSTKRVARGLADRLPNLWEGTVLDGELTAGRFEGTVSALLGSKRFRPSLRFAVFDVPVLLGADPWPAVAGAA